MTKQKSDWLIDTKVGNATLYVSVGTLGLTLGWLIGQVIIVMFLS